MISKHNISPDCIEGDDQVRIFNDGKIRDCQKSYVPKGCDVPVLVAKSHKSAHTLHLKIHSNDDFRHGILITSENCGAEFKSFPASYQKYGEDIKIKQHIQSGLVVIECGPDVKTWMGGEVSKAVFDLVNTSRFSFFFRFNFLLLLFPSPNKIHAYKILFN